MQDIWEVEQKFVVDNQVALQARLAALGFEYQRSEFNSDVYFRHPCRDFRATDEAFRLRTTDSTSCVTYKGKRLPGAVKTRPEIELPITHENREQWSAMLVLLGFTPLPAVEKSRQFYAPSSKSMHAETKILVTLDEVTVLGRFAEIELIVADRADLENAGHRITALAAELGLSTIQPRSYLSLMLTKLGIE